MNKRRPWTPLRLRVVRSIRADTEQDCPAGNYCAADVYRLASEVLERRERMAPKPICERIGQRLRQRRTELRYSFDHLAERTELSKTHLWQVETGRSEPGAGVIVRLCRVLGITADWLLGTSEDVER